MPSYYHWFVNGQELDAQSGQADKGQTPNMAIRLKTLARCMSINKHKAMEYIDEQSALEAEQSMQQTDLTKDVELVA